MPCPLFAACIVRKLVPQLSWPNGVKYEDLTREQKGEMTEDQAMVMVDRLTHKPIYWEHPESHLRVKIGEIVHNFIDDKKAWKVIAQINDGTPHGKMVLKLIRDGVLKGISLAHRTADLEPEEVSIATEGLRLDTGIEMELDQAESNTPEYKVTPEALSLTQATMSAASAPQQMAASTASSSAPPPPTTTTEAPVNTAPSAQAPTPNTPAKKLTGDQLQQVIQSVLLSNAHNSVKAQIMQLGEHYVQGELENGKLSTEREKLSNELAMARKNGAEASTLFHDALLRLTQQGVPTNERLNDHQVGAMRDLAVRDPKQYMTAMLPEVIKCSLRSNLTSAPAPLASQYAPIAHPVPPPVSSIDPQLLQQFRTFEEVVRSYGSPARAPPVIYASNKRPRQEEADQGAARWYLQSGVNLLPSTRAVWAETERVAQEGAGDTMRLQDVRTQQAFLNYAPTPSDIPR